MPKKFRSKIIGIVSVIAVLLFAAPACGQPQTSNQDTLSQAVIAMHKAAAPAARKMVDDAKAAVASAESSPNAKTSTNSVVDAKVQVTVMESAVARYEGLISAEDWQQRLVPLLREALQAYQRMLELGFPIPPVPPVILDLLQPCDV